MKMNKPNDTRLLFCYSIVNKINKKVSTLKKQINPKPQKYAHQSYSFELAYDANLIS